MKDDRHTGLIQQQFTAQAEAFARSPALHADAALALLVEAAAPRAGDVVLDVACGPGSVVTTFAPHVREAVGVDATEAMIQQARKRSAALELKNTRWLNGDVYALPFEDGAFDIVTCRFAVHHLEQPEAAIKEMLRVAKAGTRIVVCDGVASDDPAKAAALNAFERMRDPSTIGFKTRDALAALLAPAASALEFRFYKLGGRLSQLLLNSFPREEDRARLRASMEQAVEGDLLGLNARWDGRDVVYDTPVVIVSAIKS